MVACTLEFDLHADTCVVGNNCLIIHDHNRPVNLLSYNPKDGTELLKVYLNVKPSYFYQQSRESFALPHAMSSEWSAYP